MIPEDPDSDPGEPWRLAGALPCSGGALRYATLGDGPPVLMLPKLGGWLQEWRHVAPLLSGYQVIAIDPPGHGGSRMLAPPPHVQTVAESAAAIVAGLDTLGIGRIRVVGCSLGGCIGIVMASCWPGLVEQLALVSVSLAGEMTLASLAARHAANDAVAADGTPRDRSAAELAHFGPISAAVLAEQNASRAVAGPWLRPSERGVGRLPTDRHLSRVAVPTLVVNGSTSHYRQYEATAAALLPRACFATLPESGPFVHQEHPGAVAALLQHFFDG